MQPRGMFGSDPELLAYFNFNFERSENPATCVQGLRLNYARFARVPRRLFHSVAPIRISKATAAE